MLENLSKSEKLEVGTVENKNIIFMEIPIKEIMSNLKGTGPVILHINVFLNSGIDPEIFSR